MIYEIKIERWHPATQNQLAESVGSKIRLKRLDREIVALYVRVRARVPLATGRRLVGLRLAFEPGERRADPDAYWKSLLDALKQNSLLVNDSPVWCETTPVEYEPDRKPGGKAATITLEDVPPEGK